jgi:hypothetical protein
MELSSFWEATNRFIIQESLNILLNPKIPYRVHKIPPLVPYLEPEKSSPCHPIILL